MSTAVSQSLSWSFSIDTFQGSTSSLMLGGYDLLLPHSETEPWELFQLTQGNDPLPQLKVCNFCDFKYIIQNSVRLSKAGQKKCLPCYYTSGYQVAAL